MTKPYFEAVRISRNQDSGVECEARVTILFCDIVRVQEPEDDDFKNQCAKCVVYLSGGLTPWLLLPYDEMKAAWVAWLDAASNIQSVFRNN
jgi:hypothetical protein